MQLANLGGDTQNIVIGVLLLAAILAGNLIRAAQEGAISPPGSGSGERRWSGTTHRRRLSPVPWNPRLRKEGK